MELVLLPEWRAAGMGRAGCWWLDVWVYQELPGCCWAGCRAETVGQRQGSGESVSLCLSL